MTANTFATEDFVEDATDAAEATAANADNLTSGTVADARIAASLARDSEVTAAVAAEATLARNADNLTSGTVADARIASTIARDSEVTSAVAAEATLARNADNLTSGTVADARIASTLARDSEVTSAVSAEATARDAAIAVEAALARSADNLTSGTVADARVASTIARDSEVATAVSNHEAAADPHPGYLTPAEGNAAYDPLGGAISDARVASTIARDSEVTSAVAAEATLARNADNLTSGTVAEARIDSTIARDSEVTSAVSTHAALTSAVHGISAFGATLVDDTTNDAARVTLGFTAEDIDFGGFKAIALACDNGATVPTSPAPTLGQLFLHTPTGRKVLLQYDGAIWWPISSYGTTTVYVDKTDGTDAVDKGSAVDSGAYKTVQYAVNQIPPIFTGNVVVNVNGESYAETVTIGGKLGRGTSTLTIQGTTTTLDSGLAVASVGTSSFAGAWVSPNFQYPTIARTSGTWTTNQRQNKWLWMTSGASSGEVRLIDSCTTTALRPMGRLLGGIATNDTFDVREPTTIVDKFIVGAGQGSVIIADIVWNLGATTVVDDCYGQNCEVTIRRCSIPSTASSALWVQNAAKVVYDTCYTTRFRHFLRAHAFVKFVGSKLEVAAGSTGNSCIQQDQYSICHLCDGCVLEGSDGANSEGVISTSLAYTSFGGDYRQAATSTFPTTVRNCTIGASVNGNSALAFAYPVNVLYGDIRGSDGTTDVPDSGTNTTATANKLIDSGANYTGLGVAVGDKVQWTNQVIRTGVWTTVTAVDSATQLSLAADIFTATGRRYFILKDTSLDTTDDVAATGGIFL